MAVFTYPSSSVSISDVSTATNQTTIINTLNRDVVDFLDTELLDTSSTNIPASASLPLEVVASLAADVNELEIVEDIGNFIGLYTGSAASEVLQTVIPLGGGRVKIQLTSGDRISLRAMENSAISDGKIAINFLS